MTKFTKEDLKTLEKLARIHLEEAGEERVLSNLKDILNYMEMLQEVDTEKTPPLTHVIKNMKAPLVEDEISDHLDTEAFLKGAPSRVGAFLKVPAVIEDKEEV